MEVIPWFPITGRRGAMSAVLLAVFNDYASADRVRVALFRDGFPTDRVELTAACDLGRAACQPADSPHGKCVQYFHTLLKQDDQRQYSELLAQRIDEGAAAIAVQPRGTVETVRATEILRKAKPADLVAHDLANQGWEHAAAKHEGYWIEHVWLEKSPETDCIYCRLFPGSSH
jgi:hypothetical protein